MQRKRLTNHLSLNKSNVMKFFITAIVLFIFFLNSGFQCGRNINDNCPNGFKNDTVYSRINILNNNNVYHIGDSIKFYSKISDSIKPAGSAEFIYNRNNFYAGFQPYKVIHTTGVYELVYANIEFNPFVHVGQFQNYPSSAFNFLYQRAQPNNTLQVSFIAGKVGLYIFSLNETNYSSANYIRRDNDFCNGYPNAFSFLEIDQHKNYWDSLGINSISLANFSGNKIANKGDRNYIFIKVIP